MAPGRLVKVRVSWPGHPRYLKKKKKKKKKHEEQEGNFEPLGLPHCFMNSPLLFFHDILLVFGLQEDVKDWTIDLLTDALTRVEESVKRGYN